MTPTPRHANTRTVQVQEPPAAPPRPAADPKAVEAFAGKALADCAGFTNVILATLGDRVGYFRDLAAHGPLSAQHLAACTGTDLRYTQEWLGGMRAAGYVQYDPAAATFRLAPEAVPVLAQEGGPAFFGGVLGELASLVSILDPLEQAFRRGGGIDQSRYPESFYANMDRFTSSWHENLLLQQWVPTTPGLTERLERGIAVADVGCGRGRAVVKLAQAFPRSTFVGYDVYAPNVERARAAAEAAGLSDRVRFEVLDAAQGIPGRYDLVTTFDVIHDAVDPVGILRSVRQALRPGGLYLNLDINCHEELERNDGPLGAVLYGISVLYCMTTSLARGGAGLGTLGLHPPKLRELATQAGFGSVRQLPIENPFNNLYALEA